MGAPPGRRRGTARGPGGDHVRDQLAKWRWIAAEAIAARLPRPLHERVCPFCRGAAAWVREQEAQDA